MAKRLNNQKVKKAFEKKEETQLFNQSLVAGETVENPALSPAAQRRLRDQKAREERKKAKAAQEAAAKAAASSGKPHHEMTDKEIKAMKKFPKG